MSWSTVFFFHSILFGVGLAMDAFSVSMANGLRDPLMSRRSMVLIAGTFSGFQILMPLLGWICVHTVASAFQAVQRYIPWIALLLLLYIGGSMILEGLRGRADSSPDPAVGLRSLLMQGVATSIDALSVGFTISEYRWPFALAESLIIGTVTFLLCMGGLYIGKRFGTVLAGKTSVLGGLILIFIGLEICLRSIIGT